MQIELCVQLNINSMRNKYDQLKSMITGNIDILIITETKLNYTFPQSQFFTEGYSKPYRLDRTGNGGGVTIYVKIYQQNLYMFPLCLTTWRVYLLK